MKALILVGSLCALLAPAQAATINGTLWLSVYLTANAEGFGGPEEDFIPPTEFQNLSLLFSTSTGTYAEHQTYPDGTFPMNGIYNFDVTAQALPHWWAYDPSPTHGFTFDVTSVHFNLTASVFEMWGNGIAYGTTYTPTRASYRMRDVHYDHDFNYYVVAGEFIASGKSAVPDAGNVAAFIAVTMGLITAGARRLGAA